MAMYDINKTKSFYSEIAMIGDTCIYCEKEIIEKRLNKEIDIDEEHKQLKELRNKLTNRRVAKFKINGRTLCICPECISKINEEIQPKTNEEIQPKINEENQSKTNKDIQSKKIKKNQESEDKK